MGFKSYDVKCLDLATAFLADEPDLNTDLHRGRLAQEIQDCIENYIEYERPLADPALAKIREMVRDRTS